MFSFIFTGYCIRRATFGAYSHLSGRRNGIGFIAAKHFAASNFGKWFSAACKAMKEGVYQGTSHNVSIRGIDQLPAKKSSLQ